MENANEPTQMGSEFNFDSFPFYNTPKGELFVLWKRLRNVIHCKEMRYAFTLGLYELNVGIQRAEVKWKHYACAYLTGEKKNQNHAIAASLD